MNDSFVVKDNNGVPVINGYDIDKLIDAQRLVICTIQISTRKKITLMW